WKVALSPTAASPPELVPPVRLRRIRRVALRFVRILWRSPRSVNLKRYQLCNRWRRSSMQDLGAPGERVVDDEQPRAVRLPANDFDCLSRHLLVAGLHRPD